MIWIAILLVIITLFVRISRIRNLKKKVEEEKEEYAILARDLNKTLERLKQTRDELKKTIDQNP